MYGIFARLRVQRPDGQCGLMLDLGRPYTCKHVPPPRLQIGREIAANLVEEVLHFILIDRRGCLRGRFAIRRTHHRVILPSYAAGAAGAAGAAFVVSAGL